MIIVFSRAKQLNGINQIKRTLSKNHSDKFFCIDDFFSLYSVLAKRKQKITSIFCLSDSDFILAISALQMNKCHLPVVLTVYHPKQWLTSLDSNYSRTKTKVFREIIDATPGSNIIYNSPTAVDACQKISFKDDIHISVAPLDLLSASNIKQNVHREGSPIKIVTVGRFVDFKVCTVLAMLVTLDNLISSGKSFEYDVYGSGPEEHQIREKIDLLRNKEKFRIMGELPPAKFADVVSPYDVFFGMGTAVVQAAMLKVPSIIAIQYEQDDVCYGYFHKHDHSINPMFGDRTEGVPTESISDILNHFYSANNEEKNAIGEACYQATDSYHPGKVIAKFEEISANAKIINYRKVSFFDLLLIAIEMRISRLIGIENIQA